VSHRQVVKVKEIYERGKIQVIPEFGITERTITGSIGSLSKRVTALETSVTGYTVEGGLSDTVNKFTADAGDSTGVTGIYYLGDGGGA